MGQKTLKQGKNPESGSTACETKPAALRHAKNHLSNILKCEIPLIKKKRNFFNLFVNALLLNKKIVKLFIKS